MVLDRLEHWRRYATNVHFVKAFQFLEEALQPDMPDGRIDVDDDHVFALIQGYPTRPERACRFEAHRHYADIQYVYSGAEAMGWAPIGELHVVDPYAPHHDVGFYAAPQHYSRVAVRAGEFSLFYPEDAHMPGLHVGGPGYVRKCVMKVRL